VIGGKTLLIVNRSSRAGRELDVDSVSDALSSSGHRVLVRQADEFNGLSQAVDADQVRDNDRLVVAGGDGAVSGLSRLAIENRIPYGVIPCATANDFASAIRMPDDPVAAARCIAAGEIRHFDVGIINDVYFLNAIGFGIGTYVTKSLDAGDKKLLGPLAYAKSLRDAVARRRTLSVNLEIAGVINTEKAWQVTVSNGLRYGGGIAAPSGANLHDGKLYAVRIMPQPLLSLLRHLPGSSKVTSGACTVSGWTIRRRSKSPREVLSRCRSTANYLPRRPAA